MSHRFTVGTIVNVLEDPNLRIKGKNVFLVEQTLRKDEKTYTVATDKKVFVQIQQVKAQVKYHISQNNKREATFWDNQAKSLLCQCFQHVSETQINPVM